MIIAVVVVQEAVAAAVAVVPPVDTIWQLLTTIITIGIISNSCSSWAELLLAAMGPLLRQQPRQQQLPQYCDAWVDQLEAMAVALGPARVQLMAMLHYPTLVPVQAAPAVAAAAAQPQRIQITTTIRHLAMAAMVMPAPLLVAMRVEAPVVAATATHRTTATAAVASHRQLVVNRCSKWVYASRTSIEDATKKVQQQQQVRLAVSKLIEINEYMYSLLADRDRDSKQCETEREREECTTEAVAYLNGHNSKKL